jgi:hypothetical protein
MFFHNKRNAGTSQSVSRQDATPQRKALHDNDQNPASDDFDSLGVFARDNAFRFYILSFYAFDVIGVKHGD